MARIAKETYMGELFTTDGSDVFRVEEVMQTLVFKDLETGKMRTVPAKEIEDGTYQRLVSAATKAVKTLVNEKPKRIYARKDEAKQGSRAGKSRPRSSHPGVYNYPESTNLPWVVIMNRKGVKFYKSFKTEQEAIEAREAKIKEIEGGNKVKVKTPGVKYRCIGCRTVWSEKPKICTCNGTRFDEVPGDAT